MCKDNNAKDDRDTAIGHIVKIIKTQMNSEYDRLPDINNLDDLRDWEDSTVKEGN